MFIVKFLRKDPLWISEGTKKVFLPTEDNILNLFFNEEQENALIGINKDNEETILIKRGYVE